MLFEILLIGAAILGGVVVAWAIENILPAVIDFLKRKRYENGILEKGEQINEWLRNTTDPEIKAELERIKRARQALFTPLNNNGEQCFEAVIVLKPEDATGEDRMADAVLIRANGTYQEL